MGYAVRLPQLGMTMEEGDVVEWRFDDGEAFEEGDVIAVVESEKTTNDVEAREDGVFIERFVEPLESVEPGGPIAYVGEPDEEVPREIREEARGLGDASEAGDSDADGAAGVSGSGVGADGVDESSGATVATAGAVPGGDAAGASGEAKVSPRARSYARENDIREDRLAMVGGTGPDGAVVEADIVRAAQTGALTGGADTTSMAGDVAVDGRDIYEHREASRVRETVAKRMTQSAREAPQVTLNRRVPIDALLDLKDRLAEDRGLELSLSDFVLAATVEALQEYPEFNAVFEDGVHKLARNVNVGVAVDSDDGLLTPVVEAAGRRSLSDLAGERSRVVQRVLDGEHTHEDLSGGTFTITNLGHFGVETFDPIINPPQVAILGVGTVREEYNPETGEPRPEMALSLTFDHRPVDGADGARFLDEIADALTRPTGLLTLASDVGGGAGGTTAGGGSAGAFSHLDSPATEKRAAQATSSEGMRATVRSRDFEWRADEPEDVGGDDTAPNPVDQFLGGLASCLSLMFRNMADRRDVPVVSVDVAVDATPKEGRIERLDVDVTVVSSADESDVEQVLQMAERACYVNQAVDEDVERSVGLTVEAA